MSEVTHSDRDLCDRVVAIGKTDNGIAIEFKRVKRVGRRWLLSSPPIQVVEIMFEQALFLSLWHMFQVFSVDLLCLSQKAPDLAFTLRDWLEKVVSRLVNML